MDNGVALCHVCGAFIISLGVTACNNLTTFCNFCRRSWHDDVHSPRSKRHVDGFPKGHIVVGNSNTSLILEIKPQGLWESFIIPHCGTGFLSNYNFIVLSTELLRINPHNMLLKLEDLFFSTVHLSFPRFRFINGTMKRVKTRKI